MFEIKKLNLQLFAEQYVNVTTQAGDGYNLSAENKTHYDMTLIDEAGPYLVHDQFAQKRPIPRNGGKKIEFRKYTPFDKATTPLTEGVTPNGRKLDVTTVEATVEQFGDYVVLSDVLDLTAIDNNVVEATKLCGRQAGLTLDTITRNKLHEGTSVCFPNGKTNRKDLTIEDKISVKEVKKVIAHLKAVNAPKINGSYICILHPYIAADLMNDPEWIDAHKYATPENIYEGEIGKIAGCRFIETSEAGIYKGTEFEPEGLAVFTALFIADGAYGVTEITGGGLQTIIKQLGSSGVSDALNQRSSVGWKSLKTAEILIPSYIQRFECCSDFSREAKQNMREEN